MNLRSLILNAADLPSEPVEIPEWGCTVFVRTMSGAERDSFERQALERGKKGTSLENIRARFAVLTLCDENGQRLFSDDDAEALGQKSAKALDRILPVAQRLNGMGSADLETLKKTSSRIGLNGSRSGLR